MLEGLKEALQYVVGLGNSSEKVQVVEICGETYANRPLRSWRQREVSGKTRQSGTSRNTLKTNLETHRRRSWSGSRSSGKA